MIVTTVDQVFASIDEDASPDHLEVDMPDDDPEDDE